MRFLLDTHAIIWAINEPGLLSRKVRAALLDEANELNVSVASIWEIQLKVHSGKLTLPTAPQFLEHNLGKLGIKQYFAVELFHVYGLSKLSPLHKDPFDRLLVAQALIEGLTIISKDKILSQYPVPIFW